MPNDTESFFIQRRRILTLAAVATGALAARVLTACSQASTAPAEDDEAVKKKDPTDDDEYKPGESTPVTSEATKLPNPSWEARVKQIEALGPVYTAAAPGPWAGKERSHVPQVTVNSATKVTVVVQHVMGLNGLDSGTPTAPAKDAGPADSGMKEGGAVSGGGGGGGTGGGTGGGGGGTKPKDAGAVTPVDAGKDAGTTTTAPPPTGQHYITTIYLKSDSGMVVGLWEFSSGDAAPPTVEFALPAGVKSVTAYENCTWHGLWATESLPLK